MRQVLYFILFAVVAVFIGAGIRVARLLIPPAAPIAAVAPAPDARAGAKPLKSEYAAGHILIKFADDVGEQIRFQVARSTPIVQVKFPAAIAELNLKFGATAIRPLFPFDVSPRALQDARMQTLRERARRRKLPEPKIVAVALPRLDHMFIIEFPETMDAAVVARAYARAAGVETAEPDYITKIAAEEFSTFQWPLQKMNTQAPWTAGIKGTGIKVAVLDTGVDFCHLDLADRVTFASEGGTRCDNVDNDGDNKKDEAYGADVLTANYSGELDRGNDQNGHGTHVAGIIAATDHTTGVETGIVGVAPEVEIVPVRILDATGHGLSSWGMIGIVWSSYVAQTDIINNSWGTSVPVCPNTLFDTVTLVAEYFGTLVVSAAGNDSHNTCHNAPSESDYSMSVSALRRDILGTPNSDDFATTYSNNGVKIDVGAPGGDSLPVPQTTGQPQVFSTHPSAGVTSTTSIPVYDNHYTWMAGTSMAAPHVSGLAALLMQANPTWGPEEIKQAIRQTASASPIWPVQPTSQDEGFGRADATLAATPLLPWIASITAPSNTVPPLDGIGGDIKIQGLVGIDHTGGVASHTLDRYFVDVTPLDLTQPFQNIPSASWSSLSMTQNCAPLTTTVPAQCIADWDSVAVPDGQKIIRLRVVDNGGRQAQDYQQVTINNVYLSHPYHYELYELPDPIPSPAYKVGEVLRFETPNYLPPCNVHSGMWDEDPGAIPICAVMNDRWQITSPYLARWRLGWAAGENVACNTSNIGTAFQQLEDHAVPANASPYTNVGSLSNVPLYLQVTQPLHLWNIKTKTDGFYTICLVAYYSDDPTVTTFHTHHAEVDTRTIYIDRYIAPNFPIDVSMPGQKLGPTDPYGDQFWLTLKSPKIADLDHDGRKEIVFGSTVHEWDGSLRPGWTPVYTPGATVHTVGFGRTNPAIVNIDNDPDLEIVAGEMPKWTYDTADPPRIRAYDPDGTVKWTYPIPPPPAYTGPNCQGKGVRLSSIAAGRLNANRPERMNVAFTVIYDSTNMAASTACDSLHTWLYVLDATNGTFIDRAQIRGKAWNAIALGDLDTNANTLDIVVHTTRTTVGYYLAASGTPLLKPTPSFGVTYPSDGLADPVLDDLCGLPANSTGKSEVLTDAFFLDRGTGISLPTLFGAAASGKGTVYPDCFQLFGSTPLVYYGNASDIMKITFPNWTSTAYLASDANLTDNDFRVTGSTPGGAQGGPFLFDNPLQGVPIVGDVDGDGVRDILRTANSWRPFGQQVYGPWTTPYPTWLYGNRILAANASPPPFQRPTWDRSYIGRSSAAIDDVDCDGDAEVAVAAGGLLYLWQLPNHPRYNDTPAVNRWPMFQHDVRNTGNARTVLAALDSGACAKPQLTISKGPTNATANVGTQIVYTITVANSTTVPINAASQIKIVDTMPVWMAPAAWSANWTCTSAVVAFFSRQVTCNYLGAVPTVAPTALTLTVNVYGGWFFPWWKNSTNRAEIWFEAALMNSFSTPVHRQ